MPELATTLNKIRKHGPCPDGWAKLLGNLGKTTADDELLTLAKILESNGIEDATWALRAVDAKYDNAVRLFACFCAKYSLDIFEKEYPKDKRPRQAIEVAECFARGQATKDDLNAAVAAARAAAVATAWAAAGAAAGDAAGAAAWAAAWRHFEGEFIRLINLEGEYGEVVNGA